MALLYNLIERAGRWHCDGVSFGAALTLVARHGSYLVFHVRGHRQWRSQIHPGKYAPARFRIFRVQGEAVAADGKVYTCEAIVDFAASARSLGVPAQRATPRPAQSDVLDPGMSDVQAEPPIHAAGLGPAPRRRRA